MDAKSLVRFPRIIVACAVCLGACTPAGTGAGGSSARAIAPTCAIVAVTTTERDRQFVGNRAEFDSTVIVAERIDQNTDHGFTAFRGLRGPHGNPSIGFTIDVYGFSEVWLRNPFAAEVFRAQVHPARRPASGDFRGSAWSIQAQDATGLWSPVFFTGSAFNSNDDVSPAMAAPTVPQWMPVGRANPQMFACVGERSQDNAVQTTWLTEVTSSNAALGRRGGVTFIQDVVNGDDRFVPNAPGPIRGPATPPTPTIRGSGNFIRDGAVQCAMNQLEDDLGTRELHTLAIIGGRLYHSKTSNFRTATRGDGSTFTRFSDITPWGDVGQALGGGFGNIVSAALVASRPTAISVFFVAESGGRYKLWHSMRLASGAWRPVEDVFALSGDTATGTVYSWQVAAGLCPAPGASDWNAQNTETLIALWGGPNNDEILAIRAVQPPRDWGLGVTSNYSPWRTVGRPLRGVDPGRNPVLQTVIVTARPFRDPRP